MYEGLTAAKASTLAAPAAASPTHPTGAATRPVQRVLHRAGHYAIARTPPSVRGIAPLPVQRNSDTEEEVPVKSSKARFARRLSNAQKAKHRRKTRTTRNIATTKLVRKSDGKVIYVNALSLGMGKPKMELLHDPSTALPMASKSKAKIRKPKRGHSEPQLLAASQSRKLDVDGDEVDLNDFEPAHLYSTNSPCQDKPGQENCSGITSSIAPKVYHSSHYTGSTSASNFNKQMTQHEQAKRRVGKGSKAPKDLDMLSEAESEPEDNVLGNYLIDPRAMQGRTMLPGMGVPAVPFHKVLQDPKTYMEME